MSAIDRRQQKRVGRARGLGKVSSTRIRFYSMSRKHKGLDPFVQIPLTDEEGKRLITTEQINKRTFFKAKDPKTGQALWKIPKKSERGLVST